jgi:hypothetical protein
MKKLTQYLTPGLMAAALLLAPAMAYRVAAQDPAATPAPAATPTQEDKDCDDLYKKFADLWGQPKGAGQKDAYPVGKEYLTKCGTRTDEFTAYVRKQVTKYEAAVVLFEFNAERHKGPTGDPAVIYKNGKILIANKPDDLDVLVSLGYFGAAAAAKGNNAYKADAANYLKQTVQKIDAGGAPTLWDPFSGPDSGKAWLYYYQGTMIMESSPAEAMNYFYKVTQSTATDAPKANALNFIATLYDETAVPPASAEVAKYNGQPVSPESEAALAKLNQVLDRVNEYYAHVVTATVNPESKVIHDAALERLTVLYKSRNKGVDTGLTDYIASAGKKPMVDPKTPLPELPKPAAAPAGAGGTPTGTSGTTGTPAAANGGPRQPVGTGNPAPGKAAPAPSPTAPPKPAGAKPPTKMKRNHRTN